MKYILNGREIFDNAREAAEELAEWLREDEYDAVLDKLYEPFIIYGAEIEASFILKRDNYCGYLRGFYDWVREKTDEFQRKLERIVDGNATVVSGIKVECVIDEDCMIKEDCVIEGDREYDKAA